MYANLDPRLHIDWKYPAINGVTAFEPEINGEVYIDLIYGEGGDDPLSLRKNEIARLLSKEIEGRTGPEIAWIIIVSWYRIPIIDPFKIKPRHSGPPITTFQTILIQYSRGCIIHEAPTS